MLVSSKALSTRQHYSSNLKEQDWSSCLEAWALISLLVCRPNPIQISARLATGHKEGILMGLALDSLLVATGLHSQGLDGTVFKACTKINTSSGTSLPLLPLEGLSDFFFASPMTCNVGVTRLPGVI